MCWISQSNAWILIYQKLNCGGGRDGGKIQTMTKMAQLQRCEDASNKAGYTATSCGRVGRGGYARFPTFRLVLMDGRAEGRTKPVIELRVRN